MTQWNPNALAFAALLALTPAVPAVAQADLTIREERMVEVDGKPERWQLAWVGPVRDYCEAVSPEVAMTPTCAAFARGQAGRLLLRRLRDGNVVDQFDPAPAFREMGSGWTDGWSVLPRHAAREDDYERWLEDEGAFLRAVKERPPATVLELGDYDHDGKALEFLIRTEAEPSGRPLYAAVGLVGGKLGFLASTGRPDRPLVLPRDVWTGLRDRGGPVTRAPAACGDKAAPGPRSEQVATAKIGRAHV
jgi:hypothetical protein